MFKKFLLPIVWALFIAVLCGIPGRDIPHISFLELLSFDKFVHSSVFFILVTLGFRSLSKTNLFSNKNKITTVLAGIAYGILLEILQGTLFIERSADVYDVIANSSGCVFAALLYKKITQIKFIAKFF